MSTIVVFKEDGSVRINEGANEADFKGQTYLVNPSFPPGVPPHQWKLADGKIEGSQPPSTSPFKPPYFWYITIFSIGALLGYLAHML